MGICQSRPDESVVDGGGGKKPSSSTPLTSSSSTTAHGVGGGGLGLRRRPSETSVCTIIPEATDHDHDHNDHAAWKDDADADSLTGRGLVYNKSVKGAALVRGSRQQQKGGAVMEMVLSSPALTEPTVLTGMASPFTPMMTPTMMMPSAAAAASPAAAASSSPASVSSSASSSIMYPRSPVVAGTVLLNNNNSAILHEYDDDDSTAMPLEEEDDDDDDDQAPTDEENDVDDDELGPGRLVPASNKKTKGVVAAAAAASPIRAGAGAGAALAVGVSSPSRLGDAPGWRAANIVPKRVVAAAAAAPLPAATTSSADVVVDDDAADGLEDSHLEDTTTGSTSIVVSPGAASFVSGASTSAAAAAVSPMALSEFRKIQLQAQRAQVQKQRNAKAMKYKDRRQDVQGYKQLYQHFQELSKRVVRSNNKNNNTEEGGDVDDTDAERSAKSETVTKGPADAAGSERLLSPTKSSTTTSNVTTTTTTPVVAVAAAANAPSSSSSSAIRKAKSFDLQNANNWFFDFQGTDFDEVGGGMAAAASLKQQQQGQAGLSLLSESSLEVQRRLYAEKRRQRKQLGNHNKKMSSSKNWRHGTPVRGTPSLEDGDGTGLVPSPSRTTTTPMFGNLVSTMSSIVRRDYGPATRTPRNNPMPLAEDTDYGPLSKLKSPSEDRGGGDAAEWVDQEINCVGNAGGIGGGGGGGPEDAEYSYVSDMGDTASYTSNDYYYRGTTSAAAASRQRFPASQYPPPYSHSRPVVSVGGGAPRTDVTPEKLNELEAKVKALQKRNAELASTAATHSPSSGVGGAQVAADCAMSPVAASMAAAASNDTFKTPVATNRVASLRSIFEPSSKQTDQVGGSRNQDAQGNSDISHPVGSVGQSDPSDSVASLSMPILTFEEPVHQLESIEESLISASSSVAMQSEECDSPAKSLLGEDRAAAESPSKPSFVDTTQGQAVDDDDVFQVDAPEESIDLPPAEDEESVGLIVVEEPSSVPIATSGSDIPPLQGLDTVSTGASLDDDDEKAEEEKKDESNEDYDAGSTSVGTPAKPPASSTCNAVLAPVEKASEDDIGVLVRDDSAEDATQLEIFTPMKPQGSVIEGAHSPALSMPVAYQVSKKVPMDPPGAAMLDGTPSLETKRQAPRPTDSLLSPLAVRTASTPPTPHVSPVRRMPVDSSPAGGPSPQKNRWIAEMSTHQFLAMSEENALERLARLERNGAKKQTAYGPESESPTLILKEDALLEDDTSPASALFPDESSEHIEEAAPGQAVTDSTIPSEVEAVARDAYAPEESSVHEAAELDATDSSTKSFVVGKDKTSYDASESVAAGLQAGNGELGPLVVPDVDASVAASSSATTADPAKESIHGSSEDANPVHEDDDALADEKQIQDPEATSPAAVHRSEDVRQHVEASIEAVHEVAEASMNHEESSPPQANVTAEARSSVNTAATSFVTAISSSAVLMEAWDDTTSVPDSVYASFGEGGNSAPDLLDATTSIAAEASTIDASLHKVDAPPLQLSPTEGISAGGGGGVVIDKSFASIARVSPVILVADKVSSSSTTTTRGYLSSSMRPSLDSSAAPTTSAANFDDAPDDELHSDESMSIHTSKSHISHDVDGDTTSCHSGSTRPSTNVCATNPTTPNMTLEPSTVEPSVMDDDAHATLEPSRLSSTPSPLVPWSESLALASVVGQQVQDVLERYRTTREASQREQYDDYDVADDSDAPDDELRASKPTATAAATTNP